MHSSVFSVVLQLNNPWDHKQWILCLSSQTEDFNIFNSCVFYFFPEEVLFFCLPKKSSSFTVSFRGSEMCLCCTSLTTFPTCRRRQEKAFVGGRSEYFKSDRSGMCFDTRWSESLLLCRQLLWGWIVIRLATLQCSVGLGTAMTCNHLGCFGEHSHRYYGQPPLCLRRWTAMLLRVRFDVTVWNAFDGSQMSWQQYYN